VRKRLGCGKKQAISERGKRNPFTRFQHPLSKWDSIPSATPVMAFKTVIRAGSRPPDSNGDEAYERDNAERYPPTQVEPVRSRQRCAGDRRVAHSNLHRDNLRQQAAVSTNGPIDSLSLGDQRCADEVARVPARERGRSGAVLACVMHTPGSR
jgi:hypothetical protein